jgi:hypothetical protein
MFDCRERMHVHVKGGSDGEAKLWLIPAISPTPPGAAAGATPRAQPDLRLHGDTIADRRVGLHNCKTRSVTACRQFAGPVDSKPGCWDAGRVKATIDLDDELYRAIKVEAARSNRSVREIVDEALGAWLEAAETAEDLASASAALYEYQRDGGESAEAFFGALAAETRATYDPGA